MAARGERAAAGDAGDWVSQQLSSRPNRQGLNDAGFVEGHNVTIEDEVRLLES